MAFAISLNVFFTYLVVSLQNQDFLGRSILAQSQTALSLLSQDAAEGNYRKVMEKLSSEQWENGSTTKSILFYDLISREVITSNTDAPHLICRKNLKSSYFELYHGKYVSCIFVNSGLMAQVVFLANPFALLKTPQFLMVLSFNLIFAVALTLFTLVSMNFYLDRFILLLNRLLSKGPIEQNIPKEFKSSFKSIEKLSESLENMKKIVSKKTANEIYKKVIHNIRSPLNTINITLPLIKENPNTEGIVRGALKDIESSIDKALESYRKERIIPTNLYEIIEQVRAEITLSKNVTILLNACEQSKAWMREVGPSNFKSAILNILNNATEAMPQGGKITIDMRVEGQFLRIAITDEGMGIDPNILHRVGTHGFSFGKKKGNGLGLYTSKMDIESWNGKLSIKNRDGTQGAVVNIIL